jgi:peptide/nickel transport system substrate-binding protein
MMKLLALAAVVAFGAPAKAQVRNPDTLTDAEIGEVTSLDPVYPYVNSSQGLIYNVYETLIGYDGGHLDKFVPMLATNVPKPSPDGRTYRFKIRKGVVFHDGTPMTPEDVKYSLERFMLTDPAGGPAALLLEPILGLSSTRDSSGTIKVDFADVEKAVRVDGDDVVVTLKKPFAPFLSVMGRWSYVMSKQWAKAHGDWDGTAAAWKKYNNPDMERSYFFEHMNGTGPFKLERWDRTAKYVLLSRNDRYWRKPAALRRVLFKAVPEFATRRLMLQAGDADIIETPRPLVPQLKDIPGVKLVDNLPQLVTDPALFFTFSINPFANPDIGSGKLDGDGIPPDFFKDIDVRKAFEYAFDYDALLNDTYHGTAQRAKGPIPPGIPGYDPRQPYYTHDMKKAEEHMRKAFNTHLWEKGFRFTLTYNVGSENREAACQILKKNIERLNPKFRVDIRGVEWASYLDRAQRRQMPIFARGWTADYPDAHNFVFAFYDTDGRYPSAQAYHNVEMDQLIDKAVRETEPGRRNTLYAKILKLGYEDAPSIVTVHPRGVYAMRDWLKNFSWNPVSLGVYYYPLSKQGSEVSTAQ